MADGEGDDDDEKVGFLGAFLCSAVTRTMEGALGLFHKFIITY